MFDGAISSLVVNAVKESINSEAVVNQLRSRLEKEEPFSKLTKVMETVNSLRGSLSGNVPPEVKNEICAKISLESGNIIAFANKLSQDLDKIKTIKKFN